MIEARNARESSPCEGRVGLPSTVVFMLIKDFDIEKIQLLLQYFPQDLELLSIDFSNDDINFKFNASIKKSLSLRRDKSAAELYKLIQDYENELDFAAALEASQNNLIESDK